MHVTVDDCPEVGSRHVNESSRSDELYIFLPGDILWDAAYIRQSSVISSISLHAVAVPDLLSTQTRALLCMPGR
jgi:hypothetical protein